MNNSGYSNGAHVHFEVYVGGAETSYRVDPLQYCYAYPTDVVHKSETKVMHYSPTVYLGTPVARNVNVNQVEVVAETLRARKTPSTSGEILGYANKGVYTVSDLTPTEANGYKWYKIDNFWCANNSQGTFMKIYPAKVQQFEAQVSKLTAAQKTELEAWCKKAGVTFSFKEVQQRYGN